MKQFPLALFVFVSGSCSTGGHDQEPGRQQHPPDGDTVQPQPTYKGPDVQASFEERGGLHRVLVKVLAPSGGYKLRLEETRRVGAATAAYLTLEAPGPEEAATMALEEQQADVSLKPEAGAVHVYVRQVQRNVEYVQQPPAELAVVLLRK